MRALVVRLSSLGDVILTTAVLPALKEAGFEVYFLTFRPFGEVLKGQPFIDGVIEVDRERLKTFSDIREFARELPPFDVGFDLHDVLRTKLLRRFLPFRFYTYSKKAFLRRLMVLFKPFKAKWLFVPELYASALKNAGIEVKNPRPYLFVGEELKEKVSPLVPENAVVVAPGARWKTKCYPVERFAEVVELLKKRGFNPVVVGGKEEKDMGELLERRGAVSLCGKLSIMESVAAISLSSGVISNDSAVVHMARAVKKPVVAIFGPTHPAFGFAPYPDEGAALTRNLPCSPCSLHGKTRCRDQKCFEIEPETVVDRFSSLIESR